MHILIAALALVGGVAFWIYRARMAANAAKDLADLAGDVVSAARRFGFRRRYNEHPVDSVDDPVLAAGALSVAFLELGAAATADQRGDHLRALQRHLEVDLKTAEEILVMGHWLVNECNGPQPAVQRLGKRLMRLSGPEALAAPMTVVEEVAAAHGGLVDRQRDSLADLRRIFRR
ncbi:hypothetical protein [Roseicyclus mahoneyensis]|uniref:Tellurite resistance protein TerB n=1 Tax=Roseicyclus mahoneyensis TaxID=164332 RepID=A0A316GP19_9RHOB|nr:hypothetical protein [Roseicyclus mahoneyensis]PWK62091.1 hypothetical protein C7455_101117 [Roseicyclus mahoneyensis]